MSDIDLFNYVVALADDSLVYGQRLAEWCADAPSLEEELALSNVALDYIGRANILYEYASTFEHTDSLNSKNSIDKKFKSADEIAFLREGREFRNLLIYELPRGDFAFSTARQFIIDVFQVAFLQQLQTCSDATLAGMAGKAIKESRYHLRRSERWVMYLGDGTDESHQRIQQAFDDIWGYTDELFLDNAVEKALCKNGIAVDRGSLKSEWREQVSAVLEQATLRVPDVEWAVSGGRDGLHTEYLGPMLADMQYLQRAYPGLKW